MKINKKLHYSYRPTKTGFVLLCTPTVDKVHAVIGLSTTIMICLFQARSLDFQLTECLWARFGPWFGHGVFYTVVWVAAKTKNAPTQQR